MTEPEYFEFDFDPRFRLALAAAGITSATARVSVGPASFRVRFGAWSLSTPMDNLTGAEAGGPYRWYRAVGVRLSLGDRGITFGTTPRHGVCVTFRQPVRAIDPVGLLRHPGASVTVTEPERLLRVLGNAGVPVE